MNEQRTQAYLNLVNQLLSCNEGDEPRILQENQELLDEGLVQVMVAVAQQLGNAGRENEARWLMNMAQQLAQALGLLDNATTENANTSQDYFNFLMETLQKVNENPNPQLLYPFWKQNLNKLNDNLILILDNWARETLTSVNSEQAYSIAAVIGNFSNLIQQFPLSNIAANKEIAITGHEIALNIFTFDAFPQQWAMTQNNLANAYRNRIRGDKAENLERAIAAYTEALKVYTFDAFPQQWAMTQNNLANAYRNRIRGYKAENLERAISAYQEALKVFTFDAFPQQWAATQNNLANAYSNRIRGDKAENIKQAVMCYQNALQGYETAGDFLNAAEMGLTLGKIKVDRGEWYQGLAYLEKSLKIYRQFDDLKSRADTIYQIAHTHHLIGNHEKASIYYRDALRFYEYLKHDRGVAFCKASLGRLMLQIGFVEKAKELLKEATFIFKELNNEQEIAKIAEVLNCLAKIKEKQAV
jgi:tetratricopeptide (TPR) repeat protein